MQRKQVGGAATEIVTQKRAQNLKEVTWGRIVG